MHTRIARAVASSVISMFSEPWAAGPEGVVAFDTGDTVRGTRSLRVTTTGRGGYNCFATLVRSAVDLTGRNLRVTLKADDITKIDRIHFLVGDAGFANYQTFTLQQAALSSNFIRTGEWVSLTLPWAAADIRGTVPRAAITNLRVRVIDNGTGPATVRFAAIEAVAPANWVRGVVSITFDDGHASQWAHGRAVLDTRGIGATAYLIADRIGQPGYMTLAQARSLQTNSGWDIGGHAYTLAAHDSPTGLLSLTATQAEAEVVNTRQWLDRNGFDGHGFAYPQGYFDRRLADVVGQHFAHGRTIIGATRETVLPADPTLLRSSSGVSSAAGGLPVASLTQPGGDLDQMQTSPGWLIVTLHRVVTGTPANALDCSTADLAALVDACAARRIPVQPVARVLQAV